MAALRFGKDCDMATPHYYRVLRIFARNSLVREMQFRGNFFITVISNALWFAAQLILFNIIYGNVKEINGWSRYEFFAFMATGMLINKLIESIFMPNCANFSELIRTGNLDFALLKPIDTQFLISFEKLDLARLTDLVFALSLLGYSLAQLDAFSRITVMQVVMYLLLIGLGVTFFYSLMITLASTSIWFGRNQGLYDFWFYVTIFARYPRSIYDGSSGFGLALQSVFSYLLPILLVVTVPAHVILDKTLNPSWLTAVMVLSSILGLFVSRAVFHRALMSYRSASS